MRQGRCQGTLAFLLTCSVFSWGQLPDYPITYGEMKIKAGYYTERGRYLGGIPKANKVRSKFFDCEDFYSAANASSNATACMKWNMYDSEDSTHRRSSCECESVTNEAYCVQWVCHPCHSDCTATLGTERTLCECDVENASGPFCASWSCQQTDGGDVVKYEEYLCVRTSSSGHHCEAWNGNVTASDKITVAACQCVAERDGEGVCANWECKERGLDTCASRKDWCNLGWSVCFGGGGGMIGVIIICGLIYSGANDGKSVWLCVVGVVLCLFMSVSVVISGGAYGAMYVGIMWGGPIVLVSILALVRQRLPK